MGPLSRQVRFARIAYHVDEVRRIRPHAWSTTCALSARRGHAKQPQPARSTRHELVVSSTKVNPQQGARRPLRCASRPLEHSTIRQTSPFGEDSLQSAQRTTGASKPVPHRYAKADGLLHARRPGRQAPRLSSRRLSPPVGKSVATRKKLISQGRRTGGGNDRAHLGDSWAQKESTVSPQTLVRIVVEVQHAQHAQACELTRHGVRHLDRGWHPQGERPRAHRAGGVDLGEGAVSIQVGRRRSPLTKYIWPQRSLQVTIQHFRVSGNRFGLWSVQDLWG